MDDITLEKILEDLESDHVERKASLADKEKICEAIWLKKHISQSFA